MSVIAYDRVDGAPVFYGGALDFWRYRGQEVMLSGPYESGKTLPTLTKLHALLVKYPNSRAFTEARNILDRAAISGMAV